MPNYYHQPYVGQTPQYSSSPYRMSTGGYQDPGVPPFGQVTAPSAAPQSQNNQNTPNYIPGRIVQDEMDVQFHEIPMDNTFATFITKDLNHIYLKTVGGNGAVITREYRCVENEAADGNGDQNGYQEEILSKLNKLEDTIRELHTQMKNVNRQPYRQDRSNKGGNKE